MKYVIFYSWQSDLPNNTNRGFIGDVVQDAIEEIKKSDSYELEPSFDRDTLGVPGAPNITQTLMEKIRTCDAFVADISIVTGDKSNGKRLSPNPNVLLELGYAIAILGWQKIILFCNEAYGSNEDLPFDIRQHRRIGYTLYQDDPKAPVRKSLTSQLKSRLIELIQHGKDNSNHKRPTLIVSWNYWSLNSLADSDDGTKSKEVILKSTQDVNSETILKLQQEIKEIKLVDKHIDPQWNNKAKNFCDKAERFINSLSKEQISKEFFIEKNLSKSAWVTLHIENAGTLAATDVRVEISIPDWLIVFEEIPNSTPEIPIRPVPTSPRKTPSIAIGSAITMTPIHSPLLSSLQTQRTSACYTKGNAIYFWADKILHKHSIVNRRDKLFLLAKPDAPKGENKILGRAFCSESDDWVEVSLSIKVI